MKGGDKLGSVAVALQKIMYMVAVLIWHFKKNVILYFIK